MLINSRPSSPPYKLNIVIPVKQLNKAKQRLSSRYTPYQRQTLADSLLRNTLSFFQEYCPHWHRLVVTESPEAMALADQYGATTLYRRDQEGLNSALSIASQWSLDHGFSHQLIVPTDIGHWVVDEVKALLDSIDTLAQQHPRRACAVLAQAHDGGTNALLMSPPTALTPQFGPNSAWHHQQQATARQMAFKSLYLTSLSQDLDTPEDFTQIHWHQWPHQPQWLSQQQPSVMQEQRYG